MTVFSEFSEFSDLSPTARAVFAELLVHGPLSRAEVARRLDLSPSVLTKLTRPLLDAGLLCEEPQGGGGAAPGRPSFPLRVDHSRRSYVGVKITADELFAVRTDLGATVREQVGLSLLGHEVSQVADRVGQAVELLSGSGAPAAVGVGLAGTAARDDRVVRRSPFLGWRDVPLADLVERAVGVPTVLENDVRALTAAEHWFGAAVGRRTFALVTVGEGLGCGLVVHDRLVSGKDGVSGLIGHLPIDDRGPLCELGHRGCARAYVAAPSVRRSVRAALDRPELSFDDCLRLAGAGDPAARRIFDEAGAALGRVVATVANLIGPEVVVLSGETVHMYDVCASAFAESLAAHTHWTSEPVAIRVQPFAFTEWARGAAVIAIRHDLGAG
ncbi:putative NBD/HSP70 family sugar kinase [Streptosporangium becharense]|uniref:Putative NBD/HSP70 family sugar kinase n=1 Tax=Streptosporangium becharense TaxID=1816182 RepID=A0A7W9MF47_9ACTN|nr:ROK family transcriptional regulator [Streptosporangium becharense]MBB2913034.1 putative NBD/HSP70 family sugar kinase [Streptosporangium becharense]MBB5818141.1 putative NBD/HSP70 family sugar kinase [Streptosporangium becharense]